MRSGGKNYLKLFMSLVKQIQNCKQTFFFEVIDQNNVIEFESMKRRQRVSLLNGDHGHRNFVQFRSGWRQFFDSILGSLELPHDGLNMS